MGKAEQVRRRSLPWRALGIVATMPLVVALASLAVAPLSWVEAAAFAAPGRVAPAPVVPQRAAADVVPAVAPVAPIVAPSPQSDSENEAYASVNFSKPDIDIEPPPPPPPSYSGSSSGGCSYKGVAGQSGKAFLAKINNARSANGVAPLSWSSSLGCTAMRYSAKMAYTDLHNGGGAGNALRHNSSRPRGGENVAMSRTAYKLNRSQAISHHHTLYTNSSRHRANYLNPKWTRVGAGVASVTIDGTRVWYSTENFQ